MTITIDEVRKKIQARPKWLNAFQKFCDSNEIQKESEINGINACGYGIQCDECDMVFETCQCSRAMEKYLKKKQISIDYKNTSEEYFRELLEGRIK